MFRVTGDASTDCEGLTRRSFVEAGLLGLGGLTLGGFLASCGRKRLREARLSHVSMNPSADTSVILVWMSGGPGHHETWDPKPECGVAVSRTVRSDLHERARHSVQRDAPRTSQNRRPDWRCSAASITEPATIPRATTGCSPALKARTSTSPTTKSNAGPRWVPRPPISADRTCPACPRMPRCPICGAGRIISFTTPPIWAGRRIRLSSTPIPTKPTSAFAICRWPPG